MTEVITTKWKHECTFDHVVLQGIETIIDYMHITKSALKFLQQCALSNQPTADSTPSNSEEGGEDEDTRSRLGLLRQSKCFI